MLVLKFGSSTMGHLENVAKVLADKNQNEICCVLNYSPENLEKLKALLTDQEINEIDVSSIISLSDDLLRVSDEIEENKARIKNSLVSDKLNLIHGFAKNIEEADAKKTTADYSAALIAAALGAEAIEIWTDVDGLLSANPEKVKKALTIKELSYEEMMELSHFGTKLLHPPSIQPAFDSKIPIYIKNAANLDASGTVIKSEPDFNDYEINGISSIDKVSLLQLSGSGMMGVSGVAKRFFTALSDENINVILISQASSEHSICVALSPDDAAAAQTAVKNAFLKEIEKHLIEDIALENDCSVVAVVGRKMKERPGLAAKVFSVLGKNGINIRAIAQGSSELNISAVVANKDLSKSLNALHDTFFLSETTTLNLFLVGPGLVGSALLEQIEDHKNSLKKDRNLSIKLAGVINSKKMLLTENGISLNDWKEELESKGETSSLDSFIKKMIALNLPNSTFVDCTANDDVANSYGDVLKASISVVTPNKRANSGSYNQYLELKNAAKNANVKYFYETNVGAGLPVIGTLNDLIASGDEIYSIEGILSGTLSYIFNSFVPGTSFSEIVKGAKENGYTEPDPRDDLSGKDVARKLLVLAREIGIPLEEEQIELESLIPDCCKDASSVDEFMAKLPEADAEYSQQLETANKDGKVLRYIASIENGGAAKVSLQAVDANHPFYSLSGSDNIISFVSSRYKERPLVVKGPGAGVDVTAAGVFADIVRIGSYLT